MIDTFIGKTLADKYRIDSVMRETEFGRVYHATHLLMEKPVAVKILAPALAVDENIVKRFSADANGAVYIVYEDATGETLKNAVERDGMFSPERAVNITKQIAAGLSAAHLKGLIHGNLNSENVLLTADDAVKILDLGTFGGGETLDDEISAPKIEYVSPEQCVDPANADARSDIYSLGVILYEMLAGEVPFKAVTTSDLMMKHAQEPPPPLSAFRQDLPAGIEPVILQALAKNPEMRHQNAAELIDDLNRVSRGLVVSETPVIVEHQPINNNMWKTAFVVLAGILLLSAAMIWATSVKQTNPTTTMQTDANAQPVQPINPPTGMNEQGLATIVPITQDSMSNSNVMTLPPGVGGSDGNPYWQSGKVPPGAPVPQGVQPAGVFVDPANPNNPSQFMRDENGNYFIMVPQTTTANANVNTKPATTKTPKNAANTSVQPSPVPTEPTKPATSPTPEVKTTPVKTPAPTPKPTDKPKNAPTSTKTTQSGKPQDG
jgi:eukaryotic-like serine/threonine-protein kinase